MVSIISARWKKSVSVGPGINTVTPTPLSFGSLIDEGYLDAVVGDRQQGLGQPLNLGTVISIGGHDVHTR
ncbi:hypothetical protein [Methylorubrum extorquens]